MSTTDPITSKDNVRLKFARAVRDGREGGSIFIEGVRLGEEAIRSPIEISDCFVSETFGSTERESAIGAAVRDRGVLPIVCKDSVFNSITDTKTPQGIVLLARRPNSSLKLELSPTEKPIFVYLHEISDPANVGAVLRTAEAAGVDGVFLSKGSTDPYSPKAIRASMGSVFRLNITTRIDSDAFFQACKAGGTMVVGTNVTAGVDHAKFDWNVPVAIVFGSEADGLPPEIAEKLDASVHIPMFNRVESLNLAVSVGVVLFEVQRQRQIDVANG